MTRYETIYEKISATICDAKDLNPALLTADSVLSELSLDSLDYVELMVLAKREFNITLDAALFTQNPRMTLRELCQNIDTLSGEKA